MNVMLTCAGRRHYLVRYFREALAGSPGSGRVLACDCNTGAAALAEADQSFLVPMVDGPEYFDVLLELCKEQRVRLLIPLNDLELHGLAQQADRFRAAGTIPVVARPESIAHCLDKKATMQLLRALGLNAASSFFSLEEARQALRAGQVGFPLIVKPRWGSGSIGLDTAHDEHELEQTFVWVRHKVERSILARMSEHDPESSIVIQEFLGGEEFGLDVVNDLSGRHVTTLVRRKLAMRAGETDRAVTVSDPKLEAIGARLGERLAHPGNLDCDVIVTERGPFVLDLNPRFGGGYPFSHLAGANVPAALIAWARAETPDPAWLTQRPGVAACKCDQLIIQPSVGAGNGSR